MVGDGGRFVFGDGGWFVVGDGGWFVVGDGGWFVVGDGGWFVVGEDGWFVGAARAAAAASATCWRFRFAASLRCFFFSSSLLRGSSGSCTSMSVTARSVSDILFTQFFQALYNIKRCLCCSADTFRRCAQASQSTPFGKVSIHKY